MNSETIYDEKIKIIETRLTGDISNDDMITLTLQHNCYLWIANFSNARYKLNTLEIYSLPGKVSKIMEKLGEKKHLVRRAIISVNDFDDFIFLEAVAKNAGQNLQIFTNRNEAVKWLKN